MQKLCLLLEIELYALKQVFAVIRGGLAGITEGSYIRNVKYDT